jgi:uncharacterized protein
MTTLRWRWLAALLALVCASAQVVHKNSAGPVEQEQLGVSIPMRDGVRLAADVILPRATGRLPTVLVRTPYSRKTPSTAGYRYFASQGFAVVLQDVRGRYASEGVYQAAPQEGPDSSDTLNWIARQPWSDGRAVMVGSSYLGILQWWAALQNNPHLIAISPMCSGDDEYLDRWYSNGGALQIGHRLFWLEENLTPPSRVRPLFESYISHLPLRSADIAAAGIELPIWRNALTHPSYDAYWKSISVREKINRVSVPVLSWGGWFDEYAESDLDAFSRLSKQHASVETWIGPWGHNPGAKFPTRDFGENSFVPIRRVQGDWFQRWLAPPAAGESAAPPLLHLFVMGPNVWREEHEWPLARTRYTSWYITSGGSANTSNGNGALQPHPVIASNTDTFTYDPKFPVPTAGGSICCDPVVLPPGPLNQAAVEQRGDVLVYTSPVLTEELEVTGPVRTVLYVSSSANDTDFTAKLVDVEPGGRPLLVTDGIQRMRYRLSLQSPVLMKKNTPYQVTVNTGVTSYAFAAGHRIRLEISSSNFPRFDRNLNSARPNADETKLTKAKQTIFHGAGYPSALILPVIPRPPHRSSTPRRRRPSL